MRTADDTADIVIITGLSGAGRSTAAKSLEDLGWFVVDNLPPGLLPTMVTSRPGPTARSAGWQRWSTCAAARSAPT